MAQKSEYITGPLYLPPEEASEVLAACVNQRGVLERLREEMISRMSPEKELFRLRRRIQRLHRAENAILEAMECMKS